MKFAFVRAEKAGFPIKVLCRVLGVSEQGFHAWNKRAEAGRSKANRLLAQRIRVEFEASRGTYGSPRITAKLNADGEGLGRRRVARIMCELGLAAKRPKRHKCTTDSRGTTAIAETTRLRTTCKRGWCLTRSTWQCGDELLLPD